MLCPSQRTQGFNVGNKAPRMSADMLVFTYIACDGSPFPFPKRSTIEVSDTELPTIARHFDGVTSDLRFFVNGKACLFFYKLISFQFLPQRVIRSLAYVPEHLSSSFITSFSVDVEAKSLTFSRRP